MLPAEPIDTTVLDRRHRRERARRRVAERTPKRATSPAPNRTLALFGDFEEQETDERIQFLDGGQGLPLRIAANGSVERKHPTR